MRGFLNSSTASGVVLSFSIDAVSSVKFRVGFVGGVLALIFVFRSLPVPVPPFPFPLSNMVSQ